MTRTRTRGTLGSRIRRARERRGWSLQNLADASGIGKSVLSRLETGDREDPKISLVAEVAQALEVSLDELVLGRAPKATQSLAGVRRSLEAALREVDRVEASR